jgi:hypothetical protein
MVFSAFSSSSSCHLRASVSPHVLLAMPPLSFLFFFLCFCPPVFFPSFLLPFQSSSPAFIGQRRPCAGKW